MQSAPEEVMQLQTGCRTAAPDAAHLDQRLRQACRLLGGPCHQQADNVLGIIIAVNASRLLSTTWPVLFQNLRDTADTTVKLSLLRQFACISSRIPAEQRANAFRVFAQEARSLLADVHVLIANTFLRSFTLILESLGYFAQQDSCKELLAIVIRSIHAWERPEALRAAANAAVALVALTDACGTLENLLLKARDEFTLFTFAIVLDSSIPHLSHMHGVPVDLVKNLTAEALVEIFISGPDGHDNNNNSILPTVISCYLKLKALPEGGAWALAQEPHICRQVLRLLKDSKTRKILITPLLRFLQSTGVDWWKKRRVIFRFVRGGDPLTRQEAFAALAKCTQIASVDTATPADICDLISELRPITRGFFAENCTYSVLGVLSLLTALFLSEYGDESVTQQEIVSEVAALLLMPDAGRVSGNAGVHTAFLRLCVASRACLTGDLIFVLRRCLASDTPEVRREAVATMQHWCAHYILDEFDFSTTGVCAVDFYEGSFRRMDSRRPYYKHVGPTLLARNCFYFFAYLVAGVASDAGVKIDSSCDNISNFSEFVVQHVVCPLDTSHIVAPIVTSLEYVLSDLLISTQITSASTFSAIVSLYRSLLRNYPHGADAFCIFDHKDLVNFVYNILFLCCESVDPHVVPFPRRDQCMFFAKCSPPAAVAEMVRLVAEASLTNKQPLKETEFHFFTRDNVNFIAALIQHGSQSPVFMGHLRSMYEQLVVCVDILAGSNPLAALHLLDVLHAVLFGDHEDFFLERVKFISVTNCVMIRAMQFDFNVVGHAVFKIATRTVQYDTLFRSAACYSTMDSTGSLADRASQIVSFGRGGHPSFVSLYTGALTFLLALRRSPLHRPLMDKYCTPPQLEKAAAVLAELNDIFGTHVLKESGDLLAEIATLSTTTTSPVDAAHACIQNLHTQRLSEPVYLFTFLETFCPIFHRLPTGTANKLLVERGIGASAVPALLVCLAALDSPEIPAAAVALAGDKSAAPFLQNLLSAIIAQAPADTSHRSIQVHRPRGRSGNPPSITSEHPRNFARSKSSSFRGGADDVSLALKQISTGICALSFAPTQLVTEVTLDTVTIHEMLQCNDAAEAAQLLAILIDEGNLHLLSSECIVSLARCLLMRPGKKEAEESASPGVSEDRLTGFAQRCDQLLHEAEALPQLEISALLRYSVLAVLWALFPLSTRIHLHLVGRCCSFPREVVSAEALGPMVRRRIMASSAQYSAAGATVELSVLWMAARFCGVSLWGICPAELDDLAPQFQFACLASQVIGIPVSLWSTFHAQLRPLLSPPFAASPDEQRAALWLATSLMLHTPLASGTPDGSIIHSSLSECLYLYSDFPLGSVERAAARTVRRIGTETTLPFYTWRQHRRASEARVANLHCVSLQLPLGGAMSSAIADGAQVVAVSLLQALTQLVRYSVTNAAWQPPFFLADAFYAASALAAGNANFVRFAPTGSLGHGAAAAAAAAATSPSCTLASAAQDWLLRFAVEWLGDDAQAGAPPHRVLSNRTGLFPDSPAPALSFPDRTALAAASLLLSCFTTPTPNPAPPCQPPPRAAIVAVVQRMLDTDLFLYTAGHSAIVALSAASRRAEVAELGATTIAHRLGDDLSAGRWGLLSVPFALTQLLRASCAVLTMMPDEKVSTKICEGVWGGLLQRPWGRAMAMYGYYILQCLVQITATDGRQRRQWEMLRMLVMSAYPRTDPSAPSPGGLLALWSIGFRLQSQQQRNAMFPHLCFPRRVSLSYSEGACAGGVRGEHAPSVLRLKRRFTVLQELVTQATLILRTSADSSDQAARSGVQVSDLLASFRRALSTSRPAPSTAELLCLEVLTESTLSARDTFFTAINRFDFATGTRRTLLHELSRILRTTTTTTGGDGGGEVSEEVLQLLAMFFEAASRRATTEARSWWLVAVLLGALLCVMDTDVSCALMSAVVTPQPAALLRELCLGLARFYCGTPLRRTALQLLTRLHASATGEDCTAACLASVLHTLELSE